MASKRAQKRAACLGKVKHEKAGAVREATRLRRLRLGEAYDAYQCPVCGAWHVGHRTKKVRAQIATRRMTRRKAA